MVVYNLLISASWLVLIACWVLWARSVTPGVRDNWRWRREIGLRLAVLILVLLALHVIAPHHPMRAARRYAVNTNLIAGFLGAALCASGVFLSIWARVCLGRHWGMPMEEKTRPELITGGPYAYVRHPIYAGFILAILGSAIGQSISWMIALFIVGPYFVYCALREEKLMNELFPRQYSAYRKRTKMLIPFIL